jgi:hypothetical protein
MSALPVLPTSIGPANLPVAEINYNITTYDGPAGEGTFTARKSTGEVTWIDGETYKVGYSFLREQVGIDETDLQAAVTAKPRRSMWDVFFAEMTLAHIDDGPAPVAGPVAVAPVAPKATPTLQEQIAALMAENAALRTAKATGGSLSLKVSEKGALSVYGMGRFPTTLYREQWDKLFAHQDAIKAFITANSARLTTKAPKS